MARNTGSSKFRPEILLIMPEAGLVPDRNGAYISIEVPGIPAS
jgi:hypothetical protein